jgi:hypothetical protein
MSVVPVTDTIDVSKQKINSIDVEDIDFDVGAISRTAASAKSEVAIVAINDFKNQQEEVIEVLESSTTRRNTAQAISYADSYNSPSVEAYVRSYFSDIPIMAEIARCESTFRHTLSNGTVLRGRVDNADVGVMQINERYHLATANKYGIDIQTIDGNLAYARYLYNKQGTQPWNASAPCWAY